MYIERNKSIKCEKGEPMKTIRDFDLENKKVLMRVDFNVPIKDGVILDDTRIIESLPSIEYALQKGAKVILLSHLGRVKTEEDKKNTLQPISVRLSELLSKNVTFIPNTRGKELEEAVDNLKSGQVLLMENTRFEDLEGNKESHNDSELGAYWASLGDIFINDAFGTAHRAHASNVGIASHLPSGVGFLIEKEVQILQNAIQKPERPFTVILGGAKIKDKIGVIEHLVTIADYIIIGGGMAFTFLKAEGFEIGNSLLDNENVAFCKKILKEYTDKIILPIDIITNHQEEKFINDIAKEDMGCDIGKRTQKLFSQYLKMSKTIIWNGPVGMFEQEEYSYGTKALCHTLNSIDAIKIAGGGDTASAIKNFGFEDAFTHISTGGGASLELLEGKVLPGIEMMYEKETD